MKLTNEIEYILWVIRLTRRIFYVQFYSKFSPRSGISTADEKKISKIDTKKQHAEIQTDRRKTKAKTKTTAIDHLSGKKETGKMYIFRSHVCFSENMSPYKVVRGKKVK